MWSLLGSLLPLAIGVVVSPFGIVGIILVLFTSRPIRNGIGFNIGWLLAIAFWFALTYWIASIFTVRRPAHPPSWAGAVHLVIAIILLGAAAWVLLRGRHRVRRAARASRPGEVVTAAPQVPGWMRSVPKYRFARSLLLGFALCGFNPVDVSCIVGAAVDVRAADVSVGVALVGTLVFALVGLLPVAAPLVFVAFRGRSAKPLLDRLRGWLARYNGRITAGFFGLIGISQLITALGQL